MNKKFAFVIEAEDWKQAFIEQEPTLQNENDIVAYMQDGHSDQR